MSKLRNLICIVAAVLLLTGCSSSKSTKDSSSFAVVPLESVLMSYDPSGVIQIKAWGSGLSQADAVDAALKKALTDVLFKGFNEGPGISGRAPIRPLLGGANPEQKYAYYFQPFFSKGGEYLKYVYENRDNKAARTDFNGSTQRKAVTIIAVVDRPALERRLIADGVLKP